ncbi:MAG: transposase [Chlorobaculum sp.]|nr:transposase [Chlorobaculum sp.]
MSLEHAREVIGQWRDDYHAIRPHSGLGGLTPEEFRIQDAKSFQEPVVLQTGACHSGVNLRRVCFMVTAGFRLFQFNQLSFFGSISVFDCPV